jgi:hypothetical protein
MMKSYYLLEVLDGVYFVQFKGKKESLVYSVNQEEAWKTSNPQGAEKMKICLMRLYNIHSKIVEYDYASNS